MRRLMRLLVLLALATPGMLVLVPAGIAQAAPARSASASVSVSPTVLQSAWFWQTAYEQASPPVAAGPAPATEPSGVPAHDLAVAHTSNDGTSSKMTVLAFNLGALKPGTTIDSFTVSVKLDASPDAGNANAAAAPIVACLPTRLWAPANGGDYTNEPPVDCSGKATANVKGDTYTFTIPSIAQQWVDDQNVGVALVNDPANTSTPFQAVFSGAKTVKATMNYTPPVTTPPVATGTSGGTSGGGSTATGGSQTATGAGSTGPAAAPPPAGPVDLPPAGPVTGTTPGRGQAPQVAGSTPTGAAPTPVALRAPAPSAPDTAFWIGAVAIALLLVTAAVVLADPSVPVPTATTSRLGRVLRERERAREVQNTRTAVQALS